MVGRALVGGLPLDGGVGLVRDRGAHELRDEQVEALAAELPIDRAQDQVAVLPARALAILDVDAAEGEPDRPGVGHERVREGVRLLIAHDDAKGRRGLSAAGRSDA